MRDGNEPAMTGLRLRVRRGLTLIEAALVLGVSAMILVGMSQLLTESSETMRARASADRIQEVRRAAEQYLQVHYSAIDARTATGAVRIPVTGGAGPSGTALPSLQGGGFLPATYVDRNSFNQTHNIVVRRIPQAGGGYNIGAMIFTTGGTQIPDRLLGRIATMAGADAGFMAAEPVVGAPGVTLTGAFGGWTATAAEWTADGVTPETGRMASTLSFNSGMNEGALVGDYLNRNDIGIPEANTMRTSILMGDGTRITPNNTVTQEVRIGPSLFVEQNVRAGNDILAERDSAAVRDVGAGRDVTAVRDVTGQRFVDRDNPAYVLDPNQVSTLNDLRTDRLSVDTVVYGTSRGLTPAQGVRLGDLLPRYVPQYGYIATQTGANVPKPVCGPGAQPKIVLSPFEDSMRFDVVMEVGRRNQTLVTSIYGINNANAIGFNTINLAYVEDVYSQGQRTQVGRKLSASDNGLTWLVSNTGTPQAAGLAWSAVAMTYCYYP